MQFLGSEQKVTCSSYLTFSELSGLLFSEKQSFFFDFPLTIARFTRLILGLIPSVRRLATFSLLLQLALLLTIHLAALAQEQVASSVRATECISQITINSHSPTDVVEELHTNLMSIMKNAKDLGWQGRYIYLKPVLKNTYSFSEMARIVAGNHWKRFTDVQKGEFIEAFTHMSTAVYASRFNGYNGERFEITRVEELSQPSSGGAMVWARVIRKDDTTVKLSYRLVKSVEEEHCWKIIDVFYRGTMSELAAQRAQYLAILNESGYDSLIRKLNKKVDQLASGLTDHE